MMILLFIVLFQKQTERYYSGRERERERERLCQETMSIRERMEEKEEEEEEESLFKADVGGGSFKANEVN